MNTFKGLLEHIICKVFRVDESIPEEIAQHIIKNGFYIAGGYQYPTICFWYDPIVGELFFTKDQNHENSNYYAERSGILLKNCVKGRYVSYKGYNFIYVYTYRGSSLTRLPENVLQKMRHEITRKIGDIDFVVDDNGNILETKQKILEFNQKEITSRNEYWESLAKVDLQKILEQYNENPSMYRNAISSLKKVMERK